MSGSPPPQNAPLGALSLLRLPMLRPPMTRPSLARPQPDCHPPTRQKPAFLKPVVQCLRVLRAPLLGLLVLSGSAALPLAAQPKAESSADAKPAEPPPPQLRRQSVRPLPGGLDAVPMINDNNPELIRGPGILLSTFAPAGRGVPQAHLNLPLNGRFDLFSHHVYAGKPESLDSTLWLAVVAAPRGNHPVTLRLLSGSTALSQSLDPAQPSAPFLPLPELLQQGSTPVFSGPGSRVATELLQRYRSPLFPERWTLAPGSLTTLMVLEIPVRGLDPLLNGRNLQLRLQSDGPVDVATLATFGDLDTPPGSESWQALLEGPLSPREHTPTPRGHKGGIIYSRVSGVQTGSTWRGQISDPGSPYLSVRQAPISWPIASLERGSLGTGQVQTAELAGFYPGTAWAAHGNYGVEYDLSLPLRNDTAKPVQLQLALESPIKADQAQGGLRFNSVLPRAVMFRGTVEVRGLDDAAGKPAGRRSFHLVQRAGQAGPALGRISLAPGQVRQLQVRLIYPADATPPQVLSLLPVEPDPQSL
ncbi:hypothetical protein IFHNHDMJ_02589 [Synechococcus sp. CBW1107]|nr:hypothetical protein IFHNHDMJ_02589 [Synechococcus sp. CBW1107]